MAAPVKKAKLTELAALKANNIELKLSVHEMAKSIRELIAELQENIEISSKLIVILDELGYEVLINGEQVHVESEDDLERPGTDHPADAP